MIRSCRIPAVLNRICDETIHSALLVTFDGEILGESTYHSSNSRSNGHGSNPSAAAFGTLVADIASEYQRAGQDYAHLDNSNNNNNATPNNSRLECLLMETDTDCIGVAACPTVQCFVIAIAATCNHNFNTDDETNDGKSASAAAPQQQQQQQQQHPPLPGLVKARLQALANVVEQSMSSFVVAAEAAAAAAGES